MSNKYCPFCGYIYKKPLSDGESVCPTCKAAIVAEKTENKKAVKPAVKIKEDK